MCASRLLLGCVLFFSGTVMCFFPVDCLVKYDLFSKAISIFPVLFGFSITVIAIISSLDSVLTSLSWERLAEYKSTFESKILRQVILGVSYLAVLFLALLLQVLPEDWTLFFIAGKVFIFLSITSLLCSFAMPVLLYNLHMEKYQQVMIEKGSPAR